MDMVLAGLFAYDPSEIKAYLEVEGEDFELYGFASNDGIYYEKGAIFITLQATSGCVPELLKMETCDVRLRVSSTGRMKHILAWFDGHCGSLQTERVGFLDREVPLAVFKITEY